MTTVASLPDGAARPRIVLADDHPEVLEAICDLLAANVDVVRAVRSGKQLIEAAAAVRPDLVISDIQLGGPDGIELGQEILARGWSTAVILVTMHKEPQFIARALQAGIRGFVMKVDAGEELIPAVHWVLAGGTYLSKSVRTG